MAGTMLHRAVSWSGRCRYRMSPMAGSAEVAPGSSTRRPIVRTAQSPRRHRPNRSEGDGSYSRPAATTYDGTARSIRARHFWAAPERDWRNAGSAGNGPWPLAIPGFVERQFQYRNWTDWHLRHTRRNIACPASRCSKSSLEHCTATGNLIMTVLPRRVRRSGDGTEVVVHRGRGRSQREVGKVAQSCRAGMAMRRCADGVDRGCRFCPGRTGRANP